MTTAMTWIRRACGPTLLLVSSFAWATPQALLGTWKGSIGNAPVMACFDDFESQYYYLRHLHGITLWRPDDNLTHTQDELRGEPVAGHVLNERASDDAPGAVDGVGATWRLERLEGSVLTGTWTAISGKRSAPIRLTRLEGPAKEGAACATAFMAPVLARTRMRKSAGRFESHDFHLIASADATAPELGSEVPHADRFNRFAMDWLREQTVFVYRCNRGATSVGEALGRTLEPVFWGKRYLVLRDSMPEVFCGGPRGNSSLSYVVWSLPQGQAINSWAWIQGGETAVGSRPSEGGPDIPQPLRRLIVASHSRNDDCGESFPVGIGAPYPSADGLVFSTSFGHAVFACNDDVHLSWKQLLPYLSSQGRALMQAGP